MGTSVSSGDLVAAVRERGPSAYILTVSDRAAPHVAPADVSWSDGALVAAVGERTAAYARQRPHVSALYPSRYAGDYSLIVDAIASVSTTADGHLLRLSPTRAVLHRAGPAPDPESSPCGSDCVPLALPD